MRRFALVLGLGGLLIGSPALLAQEQAQEGDDIIIQSPITDGVPLDQPLFQDGFRDPALDLGPIEEVPKIKPAGIAEKGVLMRALDKVSGEVVDFELTPNQTKQMGRIQVTLAECRYPIENPTGDAAAYVVVRNAAAGDVAFKGWMLASSPALNALDHPRYDVWVLRCITE